MSALPDEHAGEHGLDAAVRSTLAALDDLPPPRALFLLGTGAGLLPLRLEEPQRASLASVEGVPEDWRGASLHAGLLGELP